MQRRGGSFGVVVVLLLALLAGGPGLVETADAAGWASAEDAMVGHINRERAAAGMPALHVNLRAARIANEWADVMGHDGQLRHNTDLKGQVSGPWSLLGENVGRSRKTGASEQELVDRLHAAFMASEGHRANVLRTSYNQVGVGVSVGADGTMWTAVVFLGGPVGQFPLYNDAAGSVHERAIERIWQAGVTTGCAPGSYCPERPVTRAEMASFLARAMSLSPVAGSRFSDVPASATHAGAINALAAASVTSGCADGRYCPDERVTRATMASFLARALDLAPSSATPFGDAPASSTHGANIAAVAAAGITQGCGDGRFCPDQPLTRAQMATFLTRAMERGFKQV